MITEHRFEDRTSVRVPGGTRAAQLAAFDELGPGLGEAWVRHVDSLQRRSGRCCASNYVEVPWDPRDVPKDRRSRFNTPRDPAQAAAPRLPRRPARAGRRAPVVAEGHDLRNVPAWAGVTNYLEQRFGAWTVPGGMARSWPTC